MYENERVQISLEKSLQKKKIRNGKKRMKRLDNRKNQTKKSKELKIIKTKIQKNAKYVKLKKTLEHIMRECEKKEEIGLKERVE